MTRVWLSIGILLALAALCMISIVSVRTECRRYDTEAQTIADALADGDKAAALAACEEMAADWGRFRTVCGIFVKGSKLSPIREELAALPKLIEADQPESAAGAARMQYHIHSIREDITPQLWHKETP